MAIDICLPIVKGLYEVRQVKVFIESLNVMNKKELLRNTGALVHSYGRTNCDVFSEQVSLFFQNNNVINESRVLNGGKCCPEQERNLAAIGQ